MKSMTRFGSATTGMKTPGGLGLGAEPFHLLEISIPSAQDLHPVSRNMSTYAVAWIQPERKLCTGVASGSHTHPQWNDKFVFRVDDWFLRNETSAVTVEIHCVGWLRDTLIGSVRVLILNHLETKTPGGLLGGMRFAPLQVRRPSGRPQGILNVGVTVLDASLRTVPLYTQLNPGAPTYQDLVAASFKPLRRTKSVSEMGSVIKMPLAESMADTVSEMTLDDKASSADGASVAGVGEDFLQAEVGSSVLEDWSVASSGGKEELRIKLERWRSEFPSEFDPVSSSSMESPAPLRRDGTGKMPAPPIREEEDEGPARCECSVSCGLKPRKKKSRKA